MRKALGLALSVALTGACAGARRDRDGEAGHAGGDPGLREGQPERSRAEDS